MPRWLPAILAFLAGLSPAWSQAFGPIITIPIEKVREPYNNIAEDGSRKSCGVRLYGEWPVFLNYTNRTSYRIYTPGLARIPTPQNTEPPGGRFRFYCYFNGIDTGNLGAECPSEIGAGLPDWYVEIQRRGPRASFSYQPEPGSPELFQFRSLSTDPEGDPIVSEHWDFGDGAEGTGVSQTHRYDKPGIFRVRLTVTDSDGLTNAGTINITVPAPKPVVSITMLGKHSRNRIELGEEFDVRVKVRATDDGFGALSNLAFIGSALTVPDIFSIVRAPAETPIGTLLPGEEREFVWTLKAEKAGQFSLISSSVSGKDAADRPVTGPGGFVRGEVSSLIVEVVQQPPRLVLGADNNGDGETNALDRRLELIVSVSNVTQQDVTDVKAVVVEDAPIRLTSLAQDLNIWLTPLELAPPTFGTIRPGPENTVRRTNVYEATDRTYAQASILLQGKVGDAGVQERGEGIVNVGGETLLEARFAIEPRPYKSGQPVRVHGSLKNVSRFRDNRGVVLEEGKTLGVAVYPTTEGNGGGGFVYRADSGARTPTGPTGFVLAPDEEIPIEAILPTTEAPQDTVLQLAYKVVVLIHGEGRFPKMANPTQYEVVEQGEFSASHQVVLQGVPEVKDPWITCPIDTLWLDQYLSCRFTKGVINAGVGLGQMAWLAGSGLAQMPGWHYRLHAWKIWMTQQTVRALMGDLAARQRIAAEIAIDLQALQDVGVESLQGVAISADGALRAMDRNLESFATDVLEGNYRKVAGGMAEVAGENVDMAFEALVAARALRAASLAADGVEGAASAALRESLQRQTDELAGKVADNATRRGAEYLPTSGILRSGMDVTDLPSVWRDAYGARAEDIKNLLKVAKDEGVSIAFRSRSPGAARLFDAGLAWLKPGGVGIKSVSDIDRIYLGYLDEWDAKCYLVEPPVPWKPKGPERDALVDAYLDRFGQLKGSSDVSKDLRKAVQERLETRLDEWPKQLEKFSDYADNGIDVNFHGEKNGLPEKLIPNNRAKQRARITPEELPAKDGLPRRQAFRLQMEGPPPRGTGVFKDITGDIDLLGIFGPDGKPLTDLAKRARIYKQLQRLIGIQHGESFTFSAGEKLREEFVRCCIEGVEGAETLLAAMPDERLRATHFRDKQSIFTQGPNGEIGPIVQEDFAFLPGTLTELASELRPSGGLQLPPLTSALDDSGAPFSPAKIQELVRGLQTVSQAGKFSRTNGVAARPDGAGGAQEYVAAGVTESRAGGTGIGTDALGGSRIPVRGGVARASEPGATELAAALAKLTADGYRVEPPTPPPGSAGGQWRPTPAARLQEGGVLRLAPLTYLTEDLPAGASVLPSLSLRDLGMDADSSFFAVGDTVVIDPGGPNEEIATLMSAHPLTLSRPLTSQKQTGDMILFLRGVTNDRSLAGALPALENLVVWLRADVGVQRDGTNVLSWTDQSRNGYVFTAPGEARRPAWVNPAVRGLPAVRFSASQLVGNLNRTLTNATLFTLCRFLGGGNSSTVYAFGTPNYSGLMMSLLRRSGGGAEHHDGAASRVADDVIPGSDFRIFSQVFGEGGADRHRLSVNLQTALETRTTTGRAYSAVATNVVLGKWITGTSYFVGDLLEWIVYDRALSLEERLEVEEYLRQRAGLGPLVPDGSLNLAETRVEHFDVSPTGNAVWTLDVANRQLKSTASDDPSMALSDFAVSEQVIRTRLRPEEGSGALGVVFGYQDRSRFHLFDWRASTSNHVDWGTAYAGMRLRSIHLPAGQEPTGADFWSGSDAGRVTIWRTNDIPWVPGREYDVVLRLGPDQTVVEVLLGTRSLARWIVPGLTAAPGRFGHFAHGSPNARFGPVVLPGGDPWITSIEPATAGHWTLRWMNGAPSYVIESTTDLAGGVWTPVAPATVNLSQTLPVPEDTLLFRVRSAGLVPEDAGPPRAPTFGNGGDPWRVRRNGPTRIEAENFDEGGEGLGYHDTTLVNSGGAHRREAVDMAPISDDGGGIAVGWIEAGEWLEYSLQVEESGLYRVRARTARGQSRNRTVRFLFDGTNRSGDVVVPATGDWNNYVIVESGPIELTAGAQVLRLDLASGGFNLNWIELVPVE
ncbi:MAG: carbohydrate-binding protein [Verrucomicrobiales bacterium]|nr:carbohydrate-binding protein [Verrucomicrobiales bacterium]